MISLSSFSRPLAFVLSMTIASAAQSAAAAAGSECRATATDAPRDLTAVFARLARAPRALAVSAEQQALDHLEGQAARRPNPELGVELEDFTGSGIYSAFGQSQATVTVSQRIELGDLRERRTDVAHREAAEGGRRGEQDLLRAKVAAKGAVVALLTARRRREISAEGERLAREVADAATARRNAGIGSEADVERARLAVAASELEESQTIREEVVARQRLASLWSGEGDEASCIVGALPDPGAVRAVADPRGESPVAAPRSDAGIDYSSTEATPHSGPGDATPRLDASRSTAVAIAEAEVETRRAELALAHAEAKPNLELGAGLRHLAGPGEVSIVAGARVEVPLFDRNTGNISAAERQLFAAQQKAAAIASEARAKAIRLQGDVEAAADRARRLSTSMIPAAERAFRALSKAWRSGAGSSLEVLDARRVLVELRLEHVDALADFHRSIVLLEGALGSVSPMFSTTLPTATASVARED